MVTENSTKVKPEAGRAKIPVQRFVRLCDWHVVEKEPPHDNLTWVKIVAHIRNNKSGTVRQYKTDAIFDDDENCVSTYIWEEGNFACDCNRQLFFDGSDADCGDERFDVNLQNPKTGGYFYKEFKI